MPLVKRMIVTVTETAKSKRTREHVLYVAPKAMKVGDVVQKPSLAQMAELVEMFPEEYTGKGIGLKFGMVLGEEYEPDGIGDFESLNAKDAAAQVLLAEQAGDEDLLAKYMASEAEKKPPRKGVLKALAAAGQEAAQALLSE